MLTTALAAALAATLAGPASARAPRLAYDYDVGAFCCSVFTVRPDGTHTRRLTPNNDAFSPVWSADHRRIAFAGNGHIWTMRADGSHKHRVRHTRFAFQPAWAPDGKRLSYTRTDSTDKPRWVETIRTDGTHRHRRGAGYESTWTPDGKSIVYTRTSGLWKMRANGRGKHRLLADGFEADVSPNGRRIAFVRDFEIFVARLDGSHVHGVTNRLPDPCDPTDSGCARTDDSPAWSPSGKRLAYSTDFSENFEIHTIRPNGSGDRLVTKRGFEVDW